MKRKIKFKIGDTVFVNYTSGRSKTKNTIKGKFFVFLRNKRLLIGKRNGWAFYVNHPELRKKTTHSRMVLTEKHNPIFK